MATFNATGVAIANDVARPWQGNRKYGVIGNRIDFGRNDTGQLFATKADNTDVIQVLQVQAGWKVFEVTTRVVTVLAGADTITALVGDGDDDNGYDNAIDLTSTGYYTSKGGTDQYATDNGKLYTSDDTIDFTLTVSGGDGGPIDSGVIIVMALVADYSGTEYRRPAVV